MTRDVKVLQAALDNLLRRGSLPPSKLSLARAEAYVAALQLPPEQVRSLRLAARQPVERLACAGARHAGIRVFVGRCSSGQKHTAATPFAT